MILTWNVCRLWDCSRQPLSFYLWVTHQIEALKCKFCLYSTRQKLIKCEIEQKSENFEIKMDLTIQTGHSMKIKPSTVSWQTTKDNNVMPRFVNLTVFVDGCSEFPVWRLKSQQWNLTCWPWCTKSDWLSLYCTQLWFKIGNTCHYRYYW